MLVTTRVILPDVTEFVGDPRRGHRTCENLGAIHRADAQAAKRSASPAEVDMMRRGGGIFCRCFLSAWMKPGGNLNFAISVLRRNPLVALADRGEPSYLKKAMRDV